MMEKKKDAVMRRIKVGKVTINIGCGGDADKIERAKKLITMLTGPPAVVTLSKQRSTFGIAKGNPVGVKVTLRGKAAEDMLKRALSGVDNNLKPSKFDRSGNFSFGLKEYIDMADTKYNHDVGMMGFDIDVTLERPGFRVKRRRVRKADIGNKHKIASSEAMQWAGEKLGVKMAE